MAEILDTDLMLVNRGGNSYKVTGLEVKDSIGGEIATIDSAVLSEQTPDTLERFTSQKFDLDLTCATGESPIFYYIKGKVFGSFANDETTLWLNFDSTGKLISPYLVSTDPGYVVMNPGNSVTQQFTFEFPQLLADGSTPDEVLPNGTSLQFIIEPNISKGGDFAPGPSVNSNSIVPSIPAADVRYILGNWATGSFSPGGGITRSYDSNNFDVPVEDHSYLLVIDNRTATNGLVDGGGGGNGGSTGATGGGSGTRARGAIYLINREPLQVRVTEIAGNGSVTKFDQISNPKGITDNFASGAPTAAFGGGNGSGFSAKLAKDPVSKLGVVDFLQSGGENYQVGDVLTWTAPAGKGRNNDLDSDWDTLIHGVALSRGGPGGRGANGTGQGDGAPIDPQWDGDGTKGQNGGGPHGQNGPGGDGGVRGESGIYCTSERGGNNRGPQSGGGGGSGAGFGGGKGGIGGATGGNTHGTGGGGGSGASFLNYDLVTNGAESGTNITGVQVYVNGAFIESVDDTVKSIPLTAATFNAPSTSLDSAQFNLIKNSFENYESSVESFKTSIVSTLTTAGLTPVEIATLGL